MTASCFINVKRIIISKDGQYFLLENLSQLCDRYKSSSFWYFDTGHFRLESKRFRNSLNQNGNYLLHF